LVEDELTPVGVQSEGYEEGDHDHGEEAHTPLGLSPVVLHEHPNRLFAEAGIGAFVFRVLIQGRDSLDEAVAFLTFGVEVRYIESLYLHFFSRFTRFCLEEIILDVVGEPPRLECLSPVLFLRVLNWCALGIYLQCSG